jgi:hypothetical protein
MPHIYESFCEDSVWDVFVAIHFATAPLPEWNRLSLLRRSEELRDTRKESVPAGATKR